MHQILGLWKIGQDDNNYVVLSFIIANQCVIADRKDTLLFEFVEVHF